MTTLKSFQTNFRNYPAGISPTDISTFFNEKLRVSIPTFQRPYSWTDEEVRDLLMDVRDAYKERRTWFIGVIYWNDQILDTYRGHREEWKSIIDGQQRMTTLFLIFRELSLLPYWCVYQNIEDRISDKDSLISEDNSSIFSKMSSSEKRSIIEDIENSARTTEAFQASGEFVDYYSTAGKGFAKKDNKVSLARDLKNPFSEYLLKDVKSQADYVSLKLFSANSYHPSEKNLYFNRGYIRNTILDFFLNEAIVAKMGGSNIADRVLEFYLGFVNTLHYNIWFIEVPLSLKADIRIFEGINDRGQPLDFVSKFRFVTLSQKIVSPGLEEEWKKLYDAHGVCQVSIFNQRSNFVDKKFTMANYVSQFIQSCGEDLTEDSERLAVLKERITGIHSIKLIDSLLNNLTISVDFNSKLFKSANTTLKGLINYNLYLNTYNDQTRVIQFFVNRQLADSNVSLQEDDCIRLFWRLNNFIFAINHNFDLAPNKKRVVIIGWIKELSESNWDVWNFKNRVPIDVLCVHLEKVSIDRVEFNILDSFRQIDVLNLNLKMGAARQYLHHINHLSDLDIFKKVDVHALRFDESAEHWLPQKPHKGQNHWGNFLALNADQIRDQLEDAVYSNASVFSQGSIETFTLEIANLSKEELLKRTVGLFGNLFLLDGKKNSALKNYGHTTKQTNAQWFHFYNLAVSSTETLQTIGEWDINRIIKRTAFIQNELKTNIVIF